jgi:hypothetical protein
MLLEFPAPGSEEWAADPVQALPTSVVPADALLFLHQVAISALEGRITDASNLTGHPVAVRLPLHARALLDKFPTFRGWSSLIKELEPLLKKPATVSRHRRIEAAVACCLFYVELGILVVVLLIAASHGSYFREFTKRPGIILLRWALLAGVLESLWSSFAGGLWFHLGIALVNADGSTTSRGRIFLRHTIDWVGLFLFCALLVFLGGVAAWFALIALVAFAVIATLSILASPERDLQDRILGTWLVPR